MDKRVRNAFVILAVVLIAMGIRAVFRFDERRSLVSSQAGSSADQGEEGKLEEVFEEKESDRGYFFSALVLGAVRNPGDYRMLRGETLGDLIDKAGGPLPGARLEELDLNQEVKAKDFFYIEGTDG